MPQPVSGSLTGFGMEETEVEEQKPEHEYAEANPCSVASTVAMSLPMVIWTSP